MSPEPLAILLGTVRALLLNKCAGAAVLPAYDAAGQQVVQGFHAAGFSAEELMSLERSLALLREALGDIARSE
jgi:hypothetical protein